MDSDPKRRGFQMGGEPSDLFRSTARYYAQYRRPCPDPVVAYLMEQFALDGHGRLLDAGCGTGQVFKPLAKYFSEIVAIDSDEEMIEQARQASLDITIPVRLICLPAEKMSVELGPFRMATFGSSFHWMDRDLVCDLVYEILEPGGCLVILCPGELRSGTTTWELEIQNILTEWLGPQRRAGSGVYQQRELHQQVIAQSRFQHFQIHNIAVCEKWSLNQILGYLSSTSYASSAVLGQRKDAFEQMLRERLFRLSQDGQFEKVAEYTAITARRPA